MKFGDIVVNGWASERNPHRVSVVISSGWGKVRVTDGRSVWYMDLDKDHKMKVVGTLDLTPYHEMRKVELAKWSESEEQ